MTDNPGTTIAITHRITCPRCGGKGMAWQWRTYGHQEMHGEYFEKCDVCKGEGTVNERI